MDFHCHVDLYPNPREVYREAIERNEFTWLVTTSPRAFAATSKALAPSPGVLITPGLHPELAHERAAELPLLLEQIRRARAVGEVGLDGSARFKAHLNTQTRIFEAVIEECAVLGGRILNIHSRQAVKQVLAVLKAHPGYGTAVLHWFSGTTAELKAAIDEGCWFSVGPAMLATAGGQRLVAMMPGDRVVPESDGPFANVAGRPVMPWEPLRWPSWPAALAPVASNPGRSSLVNNARRLLAKISG